MYFFFFQAEDGIRDLTVTGVQTCALPISARGRGFLRACLEGRTRQCPPDGGIGLGPPAAERYQGCQRAAEQGARHRRSQEDRKSVVYGKSVDLGGRRIIKKKKKRRKHE